MSATNNLTAASCKYSLIIGRMRSFFMNRPEWWTYLLCLFAWILLFINSYTASDKSRNSSHFIYCMNTGTVQAEGELAYEIQSTLKNGGVSSGIMSTISNGMVPWILMVVAMMFPLLNEPLRHVSFSVRRKDRNWGIMGFLIGYTVTWTVAGVLFLLTPLFLGMMAGEQTSFVNGLIKASGFLLAAILAWLPIRPILLTKCGQTMPIRIRGRQLYSDSILYGLKMGFACLNMCWAPMVALMLAHHNLILMYAVTIVLFYERYLLPHISKLPGYAWGAIALTLFGIEIWA